MVGEQIATAQVADTVQANVSHFEKVLDTVIDYGLKLGKNILLAAIVYFIAGRLIKWVLKLTTKALNKGKLEPMVDIFDSEDRLVCAPVYSGRVDTRNTYDDICNLVRYGHTVGWSCASGKSCKPCGRCADTYIQAF